MSGTGKWLAVKLTGISKQPGARKQALLAYLAEKSITVAEATRNGADVIIMRVTSRLGLKKIEDLAAEHSNVKTAFAN